jgi:hypothetical protein
VNSGKVFHILQRPSQSRRRTFDRKLSKSFGNYGNRVQSDGRAQAEVRSQAERLQRDFREGLSRFQWKQKPTGAANFGNYGNRLQSNRREEAGVRSPLRQLRIEFREEMSRFEWK